MREQVADGVTVLLTTQYLDEADHLADRIGVLDGGRLVAEGTAAELKRRVPGGHVAVQFADPATLHGGRRVAPAAPARTPRRSCCRCQPTANSAALRRLLDRLDEDAVVGVTVETPTSTTSSSPSPATPTTTTTTEEVAA